jgi:hypothetical protein
MASPFDQSSAGYWPSASAHAAAYPSGTSLSGLAMPSLFMSSLQHSSNHDPMIRSLYPTSMPSTSLSPSGFDMPAPVFRSMTTAPTQEDAFHFQQPKAPDAHYLSHSTKEQSLKGGFVPMQQPIFTSKLTLPESTSAPIPAAIPFNGHSTSDGPDAMPSWIEPHSHFFCAAATASLLWETIQATLCSLHEDGAKEEVERGQRLVHIIDCSPVTEPFRVQCTAYHSDNGAATPFLVRLYSAPTSQRDASPSKSFCCEFQKQKPCDRVHFVNLFKLARQRIQATHPPQGEYALQQQQQKQQHQLPLSPGLVMPSLYCFSAPALPDSLMVEVPPPSVMCESVRSLLAMCDADHFNTRLEGILALADLSATNANQSSSMHEVLVAERCHEVFLQHLLFLENTDLHRASLSALVNISSTQQSVVECIVREEKHLDAIFNHISQTNAPHVMRECARFLANAASSLGQQLLTQMPESHRSRIPSVVSQLNQSACAHCRRHASTIRTKLQLTI